MRTRRRPRMGWLLVIALSGVAATATAGPMSGQPLPQEVKMSVGDVVRMIKAGVSEDLVIARIKHNGNAFHLTAEEILELKRAQVSDGVVKVMMDPLADAKPSGRTPQGSNPSQSVNVGVNVGTVEQRVAPAGQRPVSVDRLEALQWRQRYNSAKSRKNSGLAMELIGVGVAGASIYFYRTIYENVALVASTPSSTILIAGRVRDNSKFAAALATSIGGAAFSLWGGVRRGGGSSELKDLEEERRSKGYLVLAPAPQGKGLMLAYRF